VAFRTMHFKLETVEVVSVGANLVLTF
jgi:hypothetical protein